VKIEFDPAKRSATLEARGLDMADAGEMFEGPTITVEDLRKDYGEPRFVTIGFLRRRMVAVAWTPRGAARRIISMRKTNAKEQKEFGPQFRRP
jgi:uncharacterized DUF497 family protein